MDSLKTQVYVLKALKSLGENKQKGLFSGRWDGIVRESTGSRIYGRYSQTSPSYPHTNLSFLSSWLDSYRSKSFLGEVRFVC